MGLLLLQIPFIAPSVKMEQLVKNCHTLPDVIVLQVFMEMDVVSKQLKGVKDCATCNIQINNDQCSILTGVMM